MNMGSEYGLTNMSNMMLLCCTNKTFAGMYTRMWLEYWKDAFAFGAAVSFQFQTVFCPEEKV